MKKNNIINLLIMVFIPLIAAVLISIATIGDFSYLESLNRNIKIPPIMFSVVWTILYILMGLWSYFYERDYANDKLTLSIYWLSLIINLLFVPILFLYHSIICALMDVILLLVLIIYLFFKTISRKKNYSYLLLPYILWLIVAFSLMIDLLIHN